MISKHISKKEATRSVTAMRLGIDNTPGDYEIQNMEIIAREVFEPLRKEAGGPIKINSMFRCDALNTAIGGSSKSQHVQGRAMDLDDTYGHMTNAEMYNYIKENLDFDQMIWEFGTDPESGPDANPDWVHVSYVDEDSNRKRCLQAYRENGKTRYKVI